MLKVKFDGLNKTMQGFVVILEEAICEFGNDNCLIYHNYLFFSDLRLSTELH